MDSLKYMVILFWFITAIKSEDKHTPEVYEKTEENLRIIRHPKFQTVYEPPNFEYNKMKQQDPQKIRYAQQQLIDSYVRAYQLEQAFKAPQKLKKFDNKTKSETSQMSSNAEINQDNKKVVEQLDSSSQFKKSLYEVNEDLDTASSDRIESRSYIEDENLLKSLQEAGNFLTKPTYIYANPQLNIDPSMLLQGLSYNLPENHQLIQAGFQPASKSDIEALSSLLGKSPTVQLQGLNEILNQQYGGNLPEPQALLQEFNSEVKDYTPIKEDVVDVAKPEVKPITTTTTTTTTTTSPLQTYAPIKEVISSNPEPEVETKSIYADYDSNLQYASQYAFGYKIRDYHTGNSFGHEEMRDGQTAKGHYHVLLPDGRLQSVEYWADESGYHAKVSYSSAAHH